MAISKLSQEVVAQVLRPHFDRLWRCGALPFYRYLEEYPNSAIHSLRSRASIVHDLMIHQVRKEFTEVHGVRVIDLPYPCHRTFLEIDQRLLLRFKKLDEAKQPRNYPTDFATEYEADNDLPGIPPRAHRLTLGYRLNLLQTEILDVLITSSTDRRIDFDLELFMPDQKVVSIADAEATFARAKPPRRLVRVKVTKQMKLGDE
jgi:hypothetical protein